MPRSLIVYGEKTFRVTIPDDAKVTFGPWSPPSPNAKAAYTGEKAMAGTLRVYAGTGVKTENILAVYSGVTSFRDESIQYEEQVAREEGAVIWKSDKEGYRREEKVSRQTEWVNPLSSIAAPDEE